MNTQIRTNNQAEVTQMPRARGDSPIREHQFKITIATAVLVIVYIITMSYRAGIDRAQIQADHNELDAKVDHITSRFVDMREDINVLQEKAVTRDVELAKINTKLASIEALLIDIKSDLKN